MGATYKPNVNLNNRKSTREMFMSSSQSTYKKEDFMTIQITGNAKEIAALITELQGQKEKVATPKAVYNGVPNNISPPITISR